MCVRHSDQARVMLGGKVAVASPQPDPAFDVTLTCVDTSLTPGLVPLRVQFAATPLDQA